MKHTWLMQLPEKSIIRVPGHCTLKRDLESWDFRLLISSQDTMQAFPTGLAIRPVMLLSLID
jgi:hypothetical protein